MLRIAEALKKHINFKVKTVEIDNMVFRLHYRITFWILMCGVAVVCAHEYIGERIRCIVEDSQLSHVIETFCFFTSTFTVVKHANRSVLNREIPHPGVGPDADGEEVIRHAYYQWVPFFFFFQGLCFYLPHLIWRVKEGGRMKALVEGFNFLEMLNAEKKDRSLTRIQQDFSDRMHVYENWTFFLILCEFLNLINLIFQVYLTNVFLAYRFTDLGVNVYWDEKGDEFYPLDVVFPKVTKCTFRKYGPTGSIQYHDTICIMALNVINEKTFILLWFWYIILFAITVLELIWRVISYFMHSSTKFNLVNFRYATQLSLDRTDLITVMRSCTFSEWMFLRYLASNMDGRMFKELLRNMAYSLRCTVDYQDSGMLLPPRRDDSYVLKGNPGDGKRN